MGLGEQVSGPHVREHDPGHADQCAEDLVAGGRHAKVRPAATGIASPTTNGPNACPPPTRCSGE